MEILDATRLFATLGHDGRLAVLRLLIRRAPQGATAGEIAAALDLRPSTLSVHLAGLESAGLAHGERHGRHILYRADMARLGGLVGFLLADCGLGRADVLPHPLPDPDKVLPMPAPYHALFICSGNSARSIFAEALLRDLGAGRFIAHSAGTRPYSELNPFALEVLARNGHDVADLRAKNVAEFAGPDAPRLDFVFTVCDAAANETCPPWPGQPITAHWGMPDPVKATGTDAEKALAFARAYGELRRRIAALVALPVESLSRLALQQHADDLGQKD